MSTIFASHTYETPRPDATIRVQAFKPGSVEEDGYIRVDLLEFHPDFDERMKCRAYAYIKPRPETDRPEHRHIYERQGVGYLDEPYISINEVFIHPDDLQEMNVWCAQQVRAKRLHTLVIHEQPRPFPMFKRGDRVICLEYKDSYHDTRANGEAGQMATVAEDSSPGARSTVIFDEPALNRGFSSVGMPSIALRQFAR